MQHVVRKMSQLSCNLLPHHIDKANHQLLFVTIDQAPPMEGLCRGDLDRNAFKEKIISSFVRPEPSHPAQLVFSPFHFDLYDPQLILVITARAYAHLPGWPPE